MTELISHSTPKARQRHRCHACWHDIVPNEIYTRQALTEGGSVRTWKKCHECVPGEDGFCASVRPEDCWGDDGKAPETYEMMRGLT